MSSNWFTIFLFLFVQLQSQLCIAQSFETDIHIMIDSIGCRIEEGHVTMQANPDEMYCLVFTPMGESNRIDLGKWVANNYRKATKLLLNERVKFGQIIKLEFWESDDGEGSEDDFIGSLELKIDMNNEWRPIVFTKILEIRSDNSVLFNLFGSGSDYLVTIREY